MDRTLDGIAQTLEAHLSHDNERFTVAHDLLKSHHENALKIEKNIEMIKDNHLAHIEDSLVSHDRSLAILTTDVSWIKSFLEKILVKNDQLAIDSVKNSTNIHWVKIIPTAILVAIGSGIVTLIIKFLV